MATGGGNPTGSAARLSAARQRHLDQAKPHLQIRRDFKRLTDHDDNVFGNYSSGWYVFDSSSTVGSHRRSLHRLPPGLSGLHRSRDHQQAEMDGVGYSYAFFGRTIGRSPQTSR
jgi:hypothetical protein